MKTVNVRILIRNDIDDDLALQQLVKGVVRVHGAVQLVRNQSGQLVPAPEVRTRPHVTWNGEEIESGA